MSAMEQVVLVEEGQPKASLLVTEGAPRYAAEIFQRYLKGMTGAEIPIVSGPVTGNRVIFRVREGAASRDGFRVQSRHGEIVVEASVRRGCIYGAYALLETLGCRFYGTEPLGIIVPQKETVAVPVGLDILREPDFENRLPPSGSLRDHLQWGFNFTGVAQTPEQVYLIKETGMKQYRWGHIWPTLIEKRFFSDGRQPQPVDYKGREEWLPADEKGVRRYNGETLCFSNREAFEWFIDNAVSWVLAYCLDADYVSVWSADTRRINLCQCHACQGRGWNPTDWYLYVHNAIWQKLKARGWKGVFGWIAYHGSEEPPAHIDLAEQGREMDFLYAPRPRGASQHGPFTNDHPVNIRYRDNLLRWREYLKRQRFQGTRTVFEYYYDLVLLGNLAPGRVFLIPRHTDMQEEIRFYLRQGFNGFFDCNPPSGVWFPDPLSRWIYHQLLWDVQLNLETAYQDFFDHYYGPLAGLMRRIRFEVEGLMFEPPSREVLKALRDLEGECAAALEGIGDERLQLQRRVKGMHLWVQYCVLSKESEFHEKVTQDRERGRAVELQIRRLFIENRDFLVRNGFMTEDDLLYIAMTVVDHHLRIFERMAGGGER